MRRFPSKNIDARWTKFIVQYWKKNQIAPTKLLAGRPETNHTLANNMETERDSTLEDKRKHTYLTYSLNEATLHTRHTHTQHGLVPKRFAIYLSTCFDDGQLNW